MSTPESVASGQLSKEAKDLIDKTFAEFLADKSKPISSEMKQILSKMNDALWNIAKKKDEKYENRSEAYDFIEKIHNILGRNYDPNWKKNLRKPGESKAPFIVTKELRAKNCNEFLEYLKGLDKSGVPLTGIEMSCLSIVWGSVK